LTQTDHMPMHASVLAKRSPPSMETAHNRNVCDAYVEHAPTLYTTR
jgi:hypothetical protein